MVLDNVAIMKYHARGRVCSYNFHTKLEIIIIIILIMCIPIARCGSKGVSPVFGNHSAFLNQKIYLKSE